MEVGDVVTPRVVLWGEEASATEAEGGARRAVAGEAERARGAKSRRGR